MSLACIAHNNGSTTGGYSPVQWALRADSECHSFTTSVPAEIETYGVAAMCRYMQEQAWHAISQTQHTTRRETVDLSPGASVMCFIGKVRRGAVGALSTSGLPARVFITEPVRQRSGLTLETTGQGCVVWISNVFILISSHPTARSRGHL